MTSCLAEAMTFAIEAESPKVTAPRSRSDWTEERTELLKRLWADGLSASQIAAELGGVTRNAVIGRIHRLGLSGRAKQPQRSSEMRSRRSYKPRAIVPRDAMRVDRILGAQPECEAEPEPDVIDNEIPIGQRRTVLELDDSTCRWPIGTPGHPDFFFCGGQTVTSLPYCAYHARISYLPPNMRRERRASALQRKPQEPQQEAA